MAQNSENKALKLDVSAVLGWTDDFTKFKKKVESIFGDLGRSG